jgi:hypothetical protein
MFRRRRRALARLLPRVLGIGVGLVPTTTSTGKEPVMHRTRKPRFLTATSLALVAAVLVTGAGQAERPDDRAGTLGVGSVSSNPTAMPDAFERQVARTTPATAAAIRPDDRAEPRGPGIVFSVPPAVAAAASDPFEWVDASIGAALTLAAVLVGAGLGAAIRDRRRVGLS